MPARTDHDSAILPMLFLGTSKSWELPDVTSLNTLPPHALVIPLPVDRKDVGDARLSPWFQSLNGSWDFKLLPRPEAATESELAGGGWTPIDVPGNWTMQGFGTPHYTNVIMPFADLPPHVPGDNPTGLYRRQFELPERWAGRRIVLHIAGCEGTCYVYLNGKPVGFHKD